jgi:hypothetical protein
MTLTFKKDASAQDEETNGILFVELSSCGNDDDEEEEEEEEEEWVVVVWTIEGVDRERGFLDLNVGRHRGIDEDDRDDRGGEGGGRGVVAELRSRKGVVDRQE